MLSVPFLGKEVLDLAIKTPGKVGFDACCLLKNNCLDFGMHFKEALFGHLGF